MSDPSPPTTKEVDPLVAQLRDALAIQIKARKELQIGRETEAAALLAMRNENRKWRTIAAAVAPLSERVRVARQLRIRAHRLGIVSPRNAIRSQPGKSAGIDDLIPPGSLEEDVEKMNNMKLAKRVTTTTEEFFTGGSCKLDGEHDADLDDADLGDADLGEEEIEGGIDESDDGGSDEK